MNSEISWERERERKKKSVLEEEEYLFVEIILGTKFCKLNVYLVISCLRFHVECNHRNVFKNFSRSIRYIQRTETQSIYVFARR